MAAQEESRPRRRFAPGSTDEELLADLEAVRAEDGEEGPLATAPQNLTSRQAAQLNRLFLEAS